MDRNNVAGERMLIRSVTGPNYKSLKADPLPLNLSSESLSLSLFSSAEDREA